jgi:hypothetical protein
MKLRSPKQRAEEHDSVTRYRGRASAGRLICALALAVGMGLSIPSSAGAALEHPFIENFGEVNEPSFQLPQGMAVDQASGDLLVLDRDAGTLSRWHADGTASDFSALSDNVIGGFDFGPGGTQNPGEAQVAVDNSCALHEPPLTELTTPTCAEFDPANGNIYVATRGEIAFETFAVDIFDEDGNPLGQLTEYNDGSAKKFKIPCGVAVDPLGNVYVGEIFSGVHKYEPSANPPVNGDNVANFPFAQSCNVAAGAGPVDGFIFPVQLEGKVSKLDSTSPGAEKYEVDPGPTVTATVDPASGTLYTASGSEVREFDVTGETEAIAGVPIAPGGGKVGGVAVDGDNGRIYVSRKGNPNIEVWGPAVELPLVITESASVIGDTVTMRGVVNANEGPPTSCVFEYVEASAKGFDGAISVPVTPAGPFSGNTSEAVSAEVGGLGEAAYRYRLVCSNADGPKAGETLVFDTFGEAGLPDGRAYEMVSPPVKVGEVIPPEPETQLGGSCSDCLPGENVATMPMQSNPEGEAVLYLGQPFFGGLASGPNEYLAPRSASGWGTEGLSAPTATGRFLAFSEDLSRAVLAQGDPALSPAAPTRGANAFPNLYLREEGAYEPLITTEPPNRDPGNFEVNFGGANAGNTLVPAFEHVAFEANDALTKEEPGIAPAAPEVGVGKECSLPGADCNLYEWEGGELRLVNVLPVTGAAAGGSVIGSGRMLLLGSPQTLVPANIEHAISEDGSRIFWSSEETGEVYVRVDGEETLEIPGPGNCEEGVTPKARACFLTASPDGSAVLLSDGQIYELNGAGSAYEASVDLTDSKSGFEGILGASEDLSRVYFVDVEALTEESEENENGEHAEAGELNLYAFDEGELDFIGRLLPADNGFGTRSYGAWNASPSGRTAQVSADGGQLAFMSLAALTGYDNRLAGVGDCSIGTACREVFVYAAAEESLACASCNPSGEQPLGDSNLTLLRPSGPFRQPGNLSREGEGRLFFESQDALSSRDSNGAVQDVYEWEPNGVGSCKRAGGCVYLISSGHSPNDSMFVDSSQSGDDAFFITRERLLPGDKNEQLDLYDARVGGGFEETSPAPCSPEVCAGPLGAAAAQPSAGSGSFAGPGNPVTARNRCAKGKRRVVRRGKARCVPRQRNAKRRNGNARRANRDQGGSK